ncbi:MAG: DUF4062 domain-containing protein [Acidobacteria bacterium]|nr:DUF4062 domain-containing protein [Acidobacteriota bacterium]
MIRKLLVFISSTSDLRDERHALKDLIRKFGGVYEPYLYEDEPARSDSPEARCREMVERSDIFIGILGAKYGTAYPPPGESGSIVEWEFDTARSRADLGLMAMMIKKVPPDEVEPPQQHFLQRVRDFRGLWCKEYASSSELSDDVLNSLVQWSGEITQASLEERHGSKQRAQRILKPAAIISSLLVVALFALSYAQVWTLPPAILLGACILECILLVTFILIQSI